MGMAKRPNILFLLSDQHATKVAGCYGDPLGATPNIDRIAGRGVTFDNAYCASPICTPSRMSLLTGRWPHRQSCWTLEDQLASDLPTYAHALGAAGYRTILAGRMHSIGPDQLHGFSERHVGDCSPNWLGAGRQDLGILAGAQGPSVPSAGGEPTPAVSIRNSGRGQSGYEIVDDAATDAACSRLEELGAECAAGSGRPFLLAVGFILPHCPFVARAEDYDLFESKVGPPELPRPHPAEEHPWLVKWRRHSGCENADPADVIRARTAYYGLVHALDRKIGRILDALDEAGFGDDTLVVYASDHGEQAGERDLWWKNTFYEESVRVPLVMSWPGKLPEGERRAQVVNLIDVNATILQAAGAPPLPRSNARNLLPIAANGNAPWDNETFSEYVTDLSSVWTGPEATCQRMLRSGRYKYVHVDGYQPQLFDLESDPSESRDLGDDPAYAQVRQRLAARVLDGWDPKRIRSEVDLRCDEKAILRQWGQKTNPPSRYQFRITADDSWLEPHG
jgi:choline-sulfatase